VVAVTVFNLAAVGGKLKKPDSKDMKYVFTLVLTGICFYSMGQAITNMPLNTPAIGHATSLYSFTYDSKSVAQYGFGWYNDSWQPGGPTIFISGWGGMRFFTLGRPVMSLSGSGNVGIGTEAPVEKLHVLGGVYSNYVRVDNHYSNRIKNFLASANNRSGLVLESSGAINYGMTGAKLTNFSFRWLARDNGEIDYGSNAHELMRLNSAGNLGIGTSSPTSKLTVAGNIEAREVKVAVNTGADFVFSGDYDLKPLTELESFVKLNKHLPDIAPAIQMEKDGINLAEMNIRLLQKVEELTLYLIEQNKVIQAQSKNLKEQEDRIERLEKSKE